jgi:ankyrin repeat protein
MVFAGFPERRSKMNTVRMPSIVTRIAVCLQIAAFVVLPSAASAGTPQESLVNSVQEGNLEGVKTAIKDGASVNAQHQERFLFFGKPTYTKGGFSGQLGVGWTPLFWAAHEGHCDIAKYLISQGATVDVQDGAGATPVMFAIWANKTELVELLLKHGAATVEQKYRMTLLMLAAAIGADSNCLSALLIHAIPIDAKDIDGWTALHHATRSPENAALLLKKGADPNIPTSDGLTPLMLAAKYGQREVIKALLTSKPNVNAQDKRGMSALAYAVRKGDCEIVRVLLDAGADLKLKTTEGESIEDLAKEAVDSERRNAIKLKPMGPDTVLVTEGFTYQKDARSSAPPRLSVSGAKDGVIDARGSSLIALGGGDLSYSLGAHWTFEKPDIAFRNAGYVYTSKFKDATIDFREDGVLLKGFTWHHEKIERHQSVLDLLQTKQK